MSKKIINVKYHPNVIRTMDSEELESITSDIKKLLGDEYIVIFTPFDFQEISDESLFATVENMLNTLKEGRRDKDIVKLAELIAKFVPAEHVSQGETDVDPEPKYHQCDCDCSPESRCKVIDYDA